MSKVFIIEPPRHQLDISKAKRFGEIVYVFEPNDRRCGVFETERFGNSVLKVLIEKNFNVEEDVICIVGAMLTVIIAVIAIAQQHDSFNLLMYNSVTSDYVKVMFNKSDWKGLQNVRQN